MWILLTLAVVVVVIIGWWWGAKPPCPYCEKVHTCTRGHSGCPIKDHYDVTQCPFEDEYKHLRSEFITIGSSGGKIGVDRASIKFGAGSTQDSRKVQIEVEHAPKHKAVVGHGNGKFADGGSFAVMANDDSNADVGAGGLSLRSSHQNNPSHGDPYKESTPERPESYITIYTKCPHGMENAILLRSNTSHRQERANFVDDTVNAAPEVDQNRGSLRFRMTGMIKNVVYRIMWAGKGSAAVIDDICNYLNTDEEDFFVRLHYRWDSLLNCPSEIMLVMGSGQPPRPQGKQEITDGIFTAKCTMNRHNCMKLSVTRRSNVRVVLKAGGTHNSNLQGSANEDVSSSHTVLQYTYRHGIEKEKTKRSSPPEHPCISLFKELNVRLEERGNYRYSYELHIFENGSSYMRQGPSRLELFREKPRSLLVNDKIIPVLYDVPSDVRLQKLARLLHGQKHGSMHTAIRTDCIVCNCTDLDPTNLCFIADTSKMQELLRVWSNSNPRENTRWHLLLWLSMHFKNADQLLTESAADILREDHCDHAASEEEVSRKLRETLSELSCLINEYSTCSDLEVYLKISAIGEDFVCQLRESAQTMSPPRAAKEIFQKYLHQSKHGASKIGVKAAGLQLCKVLDKVGRRDIAERLAEIMEFPAHWQGRVGSE